VRAWAISANVIQAPAMGALESRVIGRGGGGAVA